MADILNEWKLLASKKLDEINPQSAFPLLRWLSARPENLNNCSKIDEMFFKIPSKMVISLLSISCKGGFFKYPKATKKSTIDKEEIIKKYMCLYYKWSTNEYEKTKSVINEKEAINFIIRNCALDKKEYKILGVEYEKTKQYKFTDNKTGNRSIADFM